MTYASLDEVKAHLRYDDTSSDDTLYAYLSAATNAINSYITDKVTDEMRPTLKVATFLLCGYYDDGRNAESGQEHGNYLPAAVRQLLAPYRLPTAV